jgi:hypothetical protein
MLKIEVTGAEFKEIIQSPKLDVEMICSLYRFGYQFLIKSSKIKKPPGVRTAL